MRKTLEQTEPERALKIASTIMQRAGLCRYDEPIKCRRAQTPTDEDCAACIEKWLLAKARSELRKEAGNTKTPTTPAPGTRIELGGLGWIVLGPEQGGVLVIVEKLVDEKAFDEGGKNDWTASTVRKYLNGSFLKEIIRDEKSKLLPFVSDLTADNGMADYGTSEDYVFLLSDALCRKYRQHLPKYNEWWWTLTPWSCNPSNASLVRLVYTSGAFGNSNANNSNGLAPSLLLNPKSLERAQSDAPASRG